MDNGWQRTFEEALAPHRTYLCQPDTAEGETDATQALIAAFRTAHCAPTPTCEGAE